MKARKSTAYLRLVTNPLGSVHHLVELAGAEGDQQEMLTSLFASNKHRITSLPNNLDS